MLTAEAWIQIWEKIEDEQERGSGLSTKKIRTEYTRDYTVHSEVSFPFGHVNLEGYSQERNGLPNQEFAMWLVTSDQAQAISQANVENIDVSITGDASDWIVQALTYTWERPYKSLLDHLEYFRRWSCTNESQIQLAEDMVEEYRYSDVEVQSIPREEVKDLYAKLLTGVGRPGMLEKYDFEE